MIASGSTDPHTLLLEEADQDLLLQGIDLEDVLKKFHKLNGNFFRVHKNAKCVLLEGDIVFPACSAGFCRSQTLWALLKKIEDKIYLQSPHATRYGFDPYNDKMNWQRHSDHVLFDEFKQWAQIPKAIRFGFERYGHLVADQAADQQLLMQMKAYYNKKYYGPEIRHPDKRAVYLSFDKNTHAILHRLLQTNENLHNVYVYHFPLKDLISHPLPEWKTAPLSVEAYQEFSNILKELIDLSQLL